ncbi:hypothetical protein Tco_0556239 [Tanacetum coccineum]
MEEYIRLEEEKAQRHDRTFNWQTATFGKVKNYKDEDDYPIDFETEFLALVFDNTLTAILSEPTVCPPNENEVDFRISLDESDDEDYMSSEDNEITHGENGFFETSYNKIIKTFETGSFVINLNIVIWNYYVNGMLFILIINLYVPFGILLDPKRYYKDGSHTKVAEAKVSERGLFDLKSKKIDKKCVVYKGLCPVCKHGLEIHYSQNLEVVQCGNKKGVE